ncbi:MAG: PPOX class F420-dependent oxidoreductase [Proteobacteria bacterium]|nr:PPOX class F420-dependent oxidoreductase [Pseudomonadota bacterium]
MPVRLSESAKRLLDLRVFAHLATLMPDGSPKAEPVWVAREGDRVLVATDRRSLKARNIAADPRVALSLVDPDDPYEQLLIRGRVVETRPDPELTALDALSLKYIGGPFPRRKWPSRVVLVVEADLARHYRSPLSHYSATDRNGADERSPA